MWMILHQLMNSSYSKVPWVIGMGTYAVLVVLLKMSPTKYRAHTPRHDNNNNWKKCKKKCNKCDKKYKKCDNNNKCKCKCKCNHSQTKQ
ncbi:hypothetical protein HanRHA438_Chr02g0082971 [Helianthus annuus]|nr:hypothetical protein HanRHA438_Chr02g0082971 [Helianthus annuus]KAJ0952199.1 hypothetical protein HanPSC8_Chr02g0069351 [Helianthus annuus]